MHKCLLPFLSYAICAKFFLIETNCFSVLLKLLMKATAATAAMNIDGAPK